ncbi:MAG: hypothetical protein RI920_425 [Pseudomonadota bacterium]|jgi:hypothetical protein
MNTMPLLVRHSAHARHARRLGVRQVALSAICLLALGSALAQAQNSPAHEVAPEAHSDEPQELRVGKGDATRTWLGTQASRKQASSTRQTLSGPVMSTVNQRYVKSFGHEVDATPLRSESSLGKR